MDKDKESTIDDDKTKEYDDGWEKAEKLENPVADDKAPKPDDAAIPEEGGEKKPDAPDVDKKPDDAGSKKPDDAEGPQGVEKALRDTKRYATQLAEENARLRKAIEEGKSSDAIKKAEEAQKLAEEDYQKSVEEAAKEYPELKPVLDILTGKIKTVEGQLTKREQEEAARKKAADDLKAAKTTFERDVKPEVVKVHSDFDSIVSDPDGRFFKWAQQQSPAIQTAVFDSAHAADIVWAVSEYKKAAASGAVDKVKGSEEARKQNNLNLAHSLKSGSSKIPASASDKNKDDYDAGWEEAGAQLAKEGLS